jgi:hypothetical protein
MTTKKTASDLFLAPVFSLFSTSTQSCRGRRPYADAVDKHKQQGRGDKVAVNISMQQKIVKHCLVVFD